MRVAGEKPLATTALIILLSRIADVAGVVLSGPLADLCRRKVVAYLALGGTTILSYPFVLAILGQHIVLVAILQVLIVLLGMGVMHGLTPILTSESFPTKFRYSGGGISFGLGGVLGGMIAPSLLAKLVGDDVLHKWYYASVVYSVYCAAAMLALLFLRETRDISLEDRKISTFPLHKWFQVIRRRLAQFCELRETKTPHSSGCWIVGHPSPTLSLPYVVGSMPI